MLRYSLNYDLFLSARVINPSGNDLSSLLSSSSSSSYLSLNSFIYILPSLITFFTLSFVTFNELAFLPFVIIDVVPPPPSLINISTNVPVPTSLLSPSFLPLLTNISFNLSDFFL